MGQAFDIVMKARQITRPNPLAYFEGLLEDFTELHGDRYYGDDKAVIGGVGLFKGRPITGIGIQKGNNLEENIARNFGSPNPEGYRKALRLMKQAEKFHRPVLCLVNTAGAFCGAGAEERGQGEAIARNLLEMSQLRTPIISILIGEGGSGGALALAVADKVWMLENAIYSILSPEGFASILWKDAARAKEAADLMKLTANDLLALNVIDKILPEPEGGAEMDFTKTLNTMETALVSALQELRSLDIDILLEARYARFRKFC